jgi:hypothetical protein
MRAFLAAADALVSPLDAPARDALILDRSLAETMARELRAVGLETVPVASLEEGEQRAKREPGGAFVLLDSVLASRTVVRRFVRTAQRRPGAVSVVCALPRALATDYLSHLDGLTPAESKAGGPVWTAPFFFIRGEALLSKAELLLLPFKEQIIRLPAPVGVFGMAEYPVGISESYLCNASHWVHVLRANASAIAGWWFDRLRWGVVLGRAWVAWRVVCGFPWLGGRLGSSLKHVAFRARVHHTANLELTVVQKGAVIGANATIKNSFVAERAIIGEGARIFGTVIGPGAIVAANSVVAGSVVYPAAFAGQLFMQLSLLGREAAAFTNSNFFDLNFTRNIRVLHRGRFSDSGSRFLGACLGPGARVSAGVWLASGREVPKGALLVKPPGEAVGKLGALEPGVAYTVRDGALVKVDERA